MKRAFFITLSVFLSVAYSFAQPSLPARCEASLPKGLKSIILKESEADALVRSHDYWQSNRVNEYWHVYSDRADNTTYVKPDASSARYSALEFNETVRIAKIQNGFALVYTEPNKRLTYPLISADARCRGWIPMKNLLLWRSCLANEKGIYNKALLCVNLDNSSSKTKNVGSGYFGPSTTSKSFQLTSDMNFYYIMKRGDNGMSLLATQSKMDGSFSDQVLYCWVPDHSFVPWNQRSCLEPTWERESVEYFSARKIQVDIYKDKQLSPKAISWIPFNKKDASKDSKYFYRQKGEELRYPILDDGNNDIYNMSTFGVLGGPAGDPRKDSLTRIQVARLRRMLNINLAIVIDGTSSMESYYPAVKEAIKSGIQYFPQNYRINVGVVIYRDYADGESGLVEVCPFTNVKNITRINNFLDSGGSYGIRSSANDRTQTEAFYYGLNAALDELRFNKDESNIILVIGDCGNDEQDTRISQNDLISKIVDKNIQIMGFQVRNQNVAAFNSFNNQLLSIIRKSMSRSYEKLDDKVKVTPRQVKTAVGILEGYDYSANVEPQLYTGSHRFADANVNNGRMNPEMLTGHMRSAIIEFAETIQKQIDILTSLGGGFRRPHGSGTDTIGIDEAYIESILGPDWRTIIGDGLVSFRGYAKKKDASGRDFFKPVIFISSEEFQDLLKRLAPVHMAAVNSNAKDRTPYIEAMKGLVRSFVPGISDADMAKLGNSEITMMIGGLNEAAGALNAYSLDDLSNANVIPASKYLRIIYDFAQKFKKLSEIYSSKNYEFVKEFNGAKYYWIPIEELP